MKMQRRATSKTRAADAEKEIKMEDKEAQPTPEVEVIVRDTQGDQPEKPIQPGDANFLEMMRAMMEETLNKNKEELKENSKKMEENMEALRKKIMRTMRK